MSTYSDRVNAPRVTLPRKHQTSPRQQHVFEFFHPFVTAYVRAGAELLDALEVSDAQKCMLKQLFGDYEKGLKQLSLTRGTRVRFLMSQIAKSHLPQGMGNRNRETSLIFRFNIKAPTSVGAFLLLRFVLFFFVARKCEMETKRRHPHEDKRQHHE